jgi:hypothetical protein
MAEYVGVARLQVLTAACMKMTVFWSVELCNLAEIDQHFRGAYCLDDGSNKLL